MITHEVDNTLRIGVSHKVLLLYLQLTDVRDSAGPGCSKHHKL